MNKAQRIVERLLHEEDPDLSKLGVDTSPARPVSAPARPAAPPVEPDEEDEPRQLDDDELLQAWLDKNEIHRFEGDTGVRNLEEVFKVLGYEGIEEFLADNPGACEGIIEWISDWVPRTKNFPDGWASLLRQALEQMEDY